MFVCDVLPYGLEGPPAQRQVVPATAGAAPSSSPSWLSVPRPRRRPPASCVTLWQDAAASTAAERQKECNKELRRTRRESSSQW